mmetsp:Transcript_49088/g.129984  ORF Transcript_49088/g.129984 Transcript_49088/m.129984 type:complete len:138 (-) Transcript_49088:382-795(-)
MADVPPSKVRVACQLSRLCRLLFHRRAPASHHVIIPRTITMGSETSSMLALVMVVRDTANPSVTSVSVPRHRAACEVESANVEGECRRMLRSNSTMCSEQCDEIRDSRHITSVIEFWALSSFLSLGSQLHFRMDATK